MATNNRLQAAASQPVLVDVHDACLFLSAWSASLPAAASRTESVMLWALLLRFAGEWAAAVHRRVHRVGGEKACAFVPEASLESFWKSGLDNPVEAFRTWADRFSAALQQHHPPSAAAQAAAIIRHEYVREWNVSSLARHVHVPPRHLSHQFHREYRMTVSAYQRFTRLVIAMPRIRTEKIEAVALDVGYHSKKNFYRAFKRVTGLSPTQFRRLPAKQADDIIELIQRKMRAVY